MQAQRIVYPHVDEENHFWRSFANRRLLKCYLQAIHNDVYVESSSVISGRVAQARQGHEDSFMTMMCK